MIFSKNYYNSLNLHCEKKKFQKFPSFFVEKSTKFINNKPRGASSLGCISQGCPSSYKCVNKKWSWTRLRMEILLKQWSEAICTQECEPKIIPKSVTIFLCSNFLLSFEQKCWLVLYIFILKGHIYAHPC